MMRRACALAAMMAFAVGSSASASSFVGNSIFQLAFDPERNFWGDTSDISPTLSVLYRGDDYGVPVYSLAIARVGKRLIARMVRSEGLETADRPRQAGYRLVSKINSSKPTSDAKLKALLDAGAVDWLEAEVENCAGATDAVAAVRTSDWSIEGEEELSIVLHADTIKVTQRTYLQEVQYTGWVKGGEGHVTTAVLHLAETLKPCWQPSTAKAPWHRTKPKD